MYIHVEEVNLSCSGEAMLEKQLGCKFYISFSNGPLFFWVVQVRPRVMKMNDLKLFTCIPNKQLKCGWLMCGLK